MEVLELRDEDRSNPPEVHLWSLCLKTGVLRCVSEVMRVAVGFVSP